MKVDKEKCIACGMCVKDCIVRDIEIVDNKAEIKNEKCFKCGHCIAICPKDAVSSDVYDIKEEGDLNIKDSLEEIKIANESKKSNQLNELKEKIIINNSKDNQEIDAEPLF